MISFKEFCGVTIKAINAFLWFIGVMFCIAVISPYEKKEDVKLHYAFDYQCSIVKKSEKKSIDADIVGLIHCEEVYEHYKKIHEENIK